MSHIDPLFAEIVEAISKPYAPPIANHADPLQDLLDISFDEWDNDLMHDICGKRFAPAIQDLLIALSQMRNDQSQTAQFIVPKLKALREACLEEYREIA